MAQANQDISSNLAGSDEKANLQQKSVKRKPPPRPSALPNRASVQLPATSSPSPPITTDATKPSSAHESPSNQRKYKQHVVDERFRRLESAVKRTSDCSGDERSSSNSPDTTSENEADAEVEEEKKKVKAKGVDGGQWPLEDLTKRRTSIKQTKKQRPSASTILNLFSKFRIGHAHVHEQGHGDGHHELHSEVAANDRATRTGSSSGDHAEASDNSVNIQLCMALTRRIDKMEAELKRSREERRAIREDIDWVKRVLQMQLARGLKLDSNAAQADSPDGSLRSDDQPTRQSKKRSERHGTASQLDGNVPEEKRKSERESTSGISQGCVQQDPNVTGGNLVASTLNDTKVLQEVAQQKQADLETLAESEKTADFAVAETQSSQQVSSAEKPDNQAQSVDKKAAEVAVEDRSRLNEQEEEQFKSARESVNEDYAVDRL